MPTRDPVLELVRARGLAEEAKKRAHQQKYAEDLARSLDRVHATFLFLRKHEIALQQFCRYLDATTASIQHNSWNALTVELGLDSKIIGCVHNMKDVSYTERILQSYATVPEASLGKLIKAVIKIDRLDAFAALQENLEEIAADHGGQDQNDDSGFSSLDTESGNEPQMRMVYPDSTGVRSQLKKNLPFTLRHLDGGGSMPEATPRPRGADIPRECSHHVMSANGPSPEDPDFQVVSANGPCREDPGFQVVSANVPAPACKVLITFANDGKSLAKDVAKALRSSNGKRPEIGVVLLDKNWDRVQRNPENFIMRCFEKVNYVIPILTEGYLKSIRRKNKFASGSQLELSGSSLDVEYAPFIYDLAIKYYTANSCINDKVRCIVPLSKRKVLNDFRSYPLMKAYVYDTEIEGLAKRMTGTFDSGADE